MQLTFPHVAQSNSPLDTEALGAALASLLESDASLPRFVALYGDLGVGKTAFVRGFASVLSPESLVRSPTFTLVNEYRNKATKKSLFHFDMYRIDSEDDLYSMGFDDYPDRGICILEWCEKIPFALPAHYLRVTITKNNLDCPDSREIILERI
ncbi:MAG: tRNA (adenosine(37)-N6)-threonylcarbamoyltransferase complex ATPase subunit type 1 TsaE [Clostridia bacterium]|nr:tRNA (adenosine(37)-N6)-threonylcarbamoyltransferase complex ATPase subunit type 1 TsaE [Clostridia bacterium]